MKCDLFLLLALLSASAMAQDCAPVSTVEDIDLKAYTSKTWYVHQQAETFYLRQRDNFCVRADYEQLENPIGWGYTIRVQNYAEPTNGRPKGGELCAFAEGISGQDSSKLNVAPCFLPKFLAGPYWIVYYEEDDDGGYALVSGGQPTIVTTADGKCTTGRGINNSGLWIFTRSPIRDDALIEKVRSKAEDKGFDVSVLKDVNQTNCEY